MLITLLILISLFAIWQWHRKRVWKKRFDIATNEIIPQIMNMYSILWADAYKKTMVVDDWPEQLDEHIH